MESYITINGKKDNKLSVLDHGLLYGDGVYETFRVFGGRAFLFEDHLNRLYSSASGISLKIPFSKQKLIKMIRSAYQGSKLRDAFVRIIVTRGVGDQGLVTKSVPNLIIIVSDRKFDPLSKIKLTISKIRKVNKSAFDSKIKSLNYLNNILARLDAKSKGFDDAIMINEKGGLAEATTSNLFMVKKGKIFTPISDSCLLEGATRKAIIENFNVKERNLRIKDLMEADEVFLSGTVNLITSVKSLNNKTYHRFDTAKIIFKKLNLISNSGFPLSQE